MDRLNMNDVLVSGGGVISGYIRGRFFEIKIEPFYGDIIGKHTAVMVSYQKRQYNGKDSNVIARGTIAEVESLFDEIITERMGSHV